MLQLHSGAWQSDFGAHADEGAHVVTSLMVRDYLAGGWQEEVHPLKYAQLYYDQFPKVAIGHYPPGFYGLASLPLLLSRCSVSLLLFMAALSAGVGWMTWRLAGKVLESRPSAIMVAVLLCLLPLVRTYTAIVMADQALVFFWLLSVYFFGRFLSKGRVIDSLGFGLAAAAAILTKGSGLGLALVPPLAILILGSWKRVKDYRLWLAPVPVIVLAFPWMWFTREITSEGMLKSEILPYLKTAFPFYLQGVVYELGWLVAVAGGISIFLLVKESRRRECDNEEASYLVVILASALASLILLIVLPTGLDRRYLLPVLPPILILALWVIERLSKKSSPRARLLVVSSVCLLTLFNIWRPVEKTYSGSDTAIETILGESDQSSSSNRTNVLVVSDAAGEGALVASAAFLGEDSLMVARGTKLLASSDWLGRGYQLNFETREEFDELLEGSEIRYLILEQVPTNREVAAHWKWVAEQMEAEKELTRIPSLRRKGRESDFLIYETLLD